MLLYLSCAQSLLTAIMYLIPTAGLASILSATFFIVTFLVSGYTIHWRDLDYWTMYLKYISPTSWLLPILTSREHSQEAIASSAKTTICKNKQVNLKPFYILSIFIYKKLQKDVVLF